jgi:hypothetical protein
MNYKGWLNWILSGLGVGGAVFLSMAFQEGIPDKAKLTTSLTAAGIAMWAHLRTNPMKPDA